MFLTILENYKWKYNFRGLYLTITIIRFLCSVDNSIARFFISNTYKHTRLKLGKNQSKSQMTPWDWTFCYLRIMHSIHAEYSKTRVSECVINCNENGAENEKWLTEIRHEKNWYEVKAWTHLLNIKCVSAWRWFCATGNT